MLPKVAGVEGNNAVLLSAHALATEFADHTVTVQDEVLPDQGAFGLATAAGAHKHRCNERKPAVSVWSCIHMSVSTKLP